MGPTNGLYNASQIQIGCAVAIRRPIELGGRRPTGLVRGVRFERTHNHFSHRAALALCQTMGQFPGTGAAHG